MSGGNVMGRLDLLEVPLDGMNLTEAGAGTGKTYTISGLFLRLLIEKRLPVGRILVVTFTEAATQELKERIRSAVRQALVAFSSGKASDPFLASLVEKYKHPTHILRNLTEALRAFDQASIFTIHGFCARVLREHAFESGSLFDTEIITDQQDILREIVYDFWRRHFCESSPLFIHYAISRKVTPESLLHLCGNRVSLPYLKIVPEIQPVDTTDQEHAFIRCFNEVKSRWKTDRKEVKDILLNSGDLSRVTYRPAGIPGWIQAMDDYLASNGHNPVLFEGFDKFTTTRLKKAVKKERAVPSHRFFDLCDALEAKQAALIQAFDNRLVSLRVSLFQFVQKELETRKKEKNIQCFDDLLVRVSDALKGPRGNRLARTVRTRFQAALIDEFQDTDPVQYYIFKKIFGHESCVMFLVGDPKQAIYGFRNADIFTYMKAAQDVSRRYTLDHNWRSTPTLL
ncbi:MAG: UvrD-helicase domain-containing protein [Deltaproteobacteria bacterium]|nr:UvrD-helicase domain-containing protein [Deltaproteobacteria bacterium]